MGLDDMVTLGHYLAGDSCLHKLDPRVKVGSVFVLSILVLFADGFTRVLLSGLFAVVLLLSGLSVGRLVETMRPLFYLLLLLFVLHQIAAEGEPLPPFTRDLPLITYEGLATGTRVVWQFLLIGCMGTLLLLTTSPTELICGIERLLRPLGSLGVPSHDVALMISIALRFVPLLVQESGRVKEAQLARGSDLRGGAFLRKARATYWLMLPLVVNLLRRSEELALAIEARGYSRGPRTYLKELKLFPRDFKALGVLGLFVAVWAARMFLQD